MKKNIIIALLLASHAIVFAYAFVKTREAKEITARAEEQARVSKNQVEEFHTEAEKAQIEEMFKKIDENSDKIFRLL